MDTTLPDASRIILPNPLGISDAVEESASTDPEAPETGTSLFDPFVGIDVRSEPPDCVGTRES